MSCIQQATNNMVFGWLVILLYIRATMCLADPNEDEEIEWGDLFAPVDADESQAIQGEEEDEEDEDEEEDEEDGDLYADYPWL